MKKLKIVFLAMLLFTGFTSCNKEEEKEEVPNLDTATIQKLVGEWEIVGYYGTSSQTFDIKTISFGSYGNSDCTNNVKEKIVLKSNLDSDHYATGFSGLYTCVSVLKTSGTWSYSNGVFTESAFFGSENTKLTILEITDTVLIVKSNTTGSSFNRLFKLLKK